MTKKNTMKHRFDRLLEAMLTRDPVEEKPPKEVRKDDE